MTAPNDFIGVHSSLGDEFMPEWGNDEAAGLDIKTPRDIFLSHGCKTKVNTGLVIDTNSLEEKVFALALPRSSAGIKMEVRFQNTAGVIDPDYCGPDDQIYIFIRRDKLCMEMVDCFEFDEEILEREIGERWSDDSLIKEEMLGAQLIRGLALEHLGGEYDERRVRPLIDRRADGTAVVCTYIVPEAPETDLIYSKGERFCQILFLPFEHPRVKKLTKEMLADASRGGIGSTGNK